MSARRSASKRPTLPPGARTVRITATTIQRGAITEFRTGSEPPAEPMRQRRDQQGESRQRGAVCGPGGHEQPPERVRLDVGARREALDDEKGASQPPSSAAIAPRRTRRTAITPATGAHCADARAPEELAQLIHLRSPVVQVELEVAVEVRARSQAGPPLASRACSAQRRGPPRVRGTSTRPGRGARARSRRRTRAPLATCARRRRRARRRTQRAGSAV